MFHLRVLGAFVLTSPDGLPVEPLVRRSRRAALLAFLAAAGPRGLHRRDKLLAIFWPDSDAAHARAALNQSLYILRTELGEPAVVSRGHDEVGLNPSVVWCDAIAFQDALTAGRMQDALALYRGDLLDGFHVSDAPEFEHWLERERERLRRKAADAAWLLAERLASQGDSVEAARWARQASEFLPADEAVARRLMTFLRDLGDRAAAVRAYETFAGTLRSEYELQPSSETSSLANAIRLEQQPVHEVSLAPPAGRAAGTANRSVPASVFASRRRVGFFGFGALVLLGTFVLSLRTPGSEATALRGPRLAVLPFENLGAKDEQYFADGMTEELNSRLAMMSGLVVVSRMSATQYAGTRKSLRQIGEELGVEYVLEGTVRSDRAAPSNTEVRVAPRLIRTSDETLVWSDRYTANTGPGEVFRVQADIAERVADALNITLREREKLLVTARPTNDAYAYDYYLRARAHDIGGFDEDANRLAEEMYRRAIAADSGFALAYARLARTHAQAYWFYYDRTASRIALAKQAADRALTLKPDLPEAHLALGYYHYWGRLAYEDALLEFRAAQRLGLNGAELFLAIANVQRRQGKFGEAIANLESALARDPRASSLPFELANAYATQGEVTRAAHYYDRAALLNPRNTRAYWRKAKLYLGADARPRAARAALETPSAPATDSVIQFYLASIDALEGKYEHALDRLRASTARAMDYQWRFVPKAQLQAVIHARLGSSTLARAYYDSARVVAARQLEVRADDANIHGALALALAGVGRKQEAIDEARKAVDLMPLTMDALRGLYRLEELARVYAMVGDHEKALDELEHIFALPGGKFLPIMELGAPWDALRDHPRFQALVRSNR
jgi:TolB-like protein/DNA-binding SARP family transcriptional activator